MKKQLAVAIISVLVLLLWMMACAPLNEFVKYASEPNYPKYENDALNLPGLKEPVLVYYDKGGVPHIEARDQKDLMRAIGFVQSRDRFFAMDAMRRIARGCMSEIVGERDMLESSTIEFDLSMRGWGMEEAAVDDVERLDTEERELMDAYVAGVNYALEIIVPMEYRMLQISPEPWRIEDSFVLGRLIAWSVTHNFHQETARFLLAWSLGLERAEAIYGNDFWHGGFSLPDGESTRTLPPALADELKAMLTEAHFDPTPAVDPAQAVSRLAADAGVLLTGASNSWVVGGDLSVSGAPILANDPHMTHFLPSLFYLQHIKAGELDVIGATVAGLPYILMGHNQYAAWAGTSTVGDAVDLYVEKQNPDNPEQYLTPEGWRDFEKKQVRITVFKEGRYFEQVFVIRKTRHGPLMNDMYPDLFQPGTPLLALHWPVENMHDSFKMLRQANMAHNVKELRLNLAGIPSPMQNWSIADTQGGIAHFISGRAPLRTKHLGTFPVPGWVDTYDFTGFLPAEKMPFAEAAEGFFANANNLSVNPEHADAYLQIDSAPSYRYDRIVQLIGEQKTHDWHSMARMQVDQKSLRAESIVPLMTQDIERLDAATLRNRERKSLDLLKKWNYEARVDSPAAAIFFMTYREAVIEALRDEVPESTYAFIMSQRYSTNVADLWFRDAKNPVWDDRRTAAVETRADVIVSAFKHAVKELKRQQPGKPMRWKWGELHDMQLKHFFGGNPAMAVIANIPRIQVGGELDTIWKSHFDMGHPLHPFRAVAGPAYRMIVDLGDIEHAHWILDTGESGWPLSPHYDDHFELWKEGRYLPMTSDWSEIRNDSEAVMTLK